MSKHLAMKEYGGKTPHILDMPLDGSKWTASYPGLFIPGPEEWVHIPIGKGAGDWVTGLDIVETLILHVSILQ
jgi:hypothetical protein